MKVPGKIKKFGTLIEAIHQHVDMNHYYLVIYRHLQSGGTLIDIKAFNPAMGQNAVAQILWIPEREHLLVLPDEICKPHQQPVMVNTNPRFR